MKYIGERIKFLREEHLRCNQKEFASIVNQYQKRKFQSEKINKFKQTNISNIENGKFPTDKLIILINFFYEEHNINLNWLLLEENNIHTTFIFNVDLDKGLNDIFKEINTYAEGIKKRINDVQIVILNTPQLNPIE